MGRARTHLGDESAYLGILGHMRRGPQEKERVCQFGEGDLGVTVI